jgi:hypothetical protein
VGESGGVKNDAGVKETGKLQRLLLLKANFSYSHPRIILGTAANGAGAKTTI